MEITYSGKGWDITNLAMPVFEEHGWIIESKPPINFSELAETLSIRCRELAQQDGLSLSLQVTCGQETVLRHVAPFRLKCLKHGIIDNRKTSIEPDDDRIDRLKRIFEQAVAEINEKQAR